MKSKVCNIKFFLIGLCLVYSCSNDQRSRNNALQQLRWQSIKLFETLTLHEKHDLIDLSPFQKTLHPINKTFLGTFERNYYGSTPPDSFSIKWKFRLGKGMTTIGRDTHIWAGAGWTGQPLLIYENKTPMIIQGAYDHSLRKINGETGKEIWQYYFDDVIKGTGTFYFNKNHRNLEESCMIIQGARSGGHLYKKDAYSLRAISYFTGKELWRLNIGRTRSYSRDVDASGLVIDSTLYIGLENGIFCLIDLSLFSRIKSDSFYTPRIIKQNDTLYTQSDIRLHGGNLVTEASPTLLNEAIFVASGAGHFHQFNLQKNQFEWSLSTLSDLDGTPSVTYDDNLLLPVEKQFIKGPGGLLKIDPTNKKPIRWYFPTPDHRYESWQGGIIGSASHNTNYREYGRSNFACFNAIDGYMYVIDLDTLDGTDTLFDGKTIIPKPKLIYKYYTGPSISTPIIVDNFIISAGYKGTFIFQYTKDMRFDMIKKLRIRAEATPFCYDGKIFLASRDGFLYCIE